MDKYYFGPEDYDADEDDSGLTIPLKEGNEPTEYGQQTLLEQFDE